jgi:hypothetical protein
MMYCVALRFGACRLNAVPPLDSCTYLAVDNGATPVAFDLYSDLLLVLGTEPPTHRPLPSARTSLYDSGRAACIWAVVTFFVAAGSEKQAYLDQPIRVASPSSRVRHLREVPPPQ